MSPCICFYVCMSALVCLCIRVCMCICLCVCVYMFIGVSTYVSVYVYVYVYVCLRVLKIITMEKDFWKATFPAILLDKHSEEIRDIYTSPEPQSSAGDLGLALAQQMSVNSLLLPSSSLSFRQEKLLT